MSILDAAQVSVTPEPTEAELTAILAAYDQLWPDPSPPAGHAGPPSWRFSGRWWRNDTTWAGWAR